MTSLDRWLKVLPIALALPVLSFAGVTRAWLLLNTTSEETLLVTDPAEQKRLTEGGWEEEAVLGLFSEGDARRSALHRMFKAVDQRPHRLLAAHADEARQAKENGFAEEGVMGYVVLTKAQPELVPVKRFKKGERFIWLVGDTHLAWAEKSGWKPVGDDFWVLSDPK